MKPLRFAAIAGISLVIAFLLVQNGKMRAEIKRLKSTAAAAKPTAKGTRVSKSPRRDSAIERAELEGQTPEEVDSIVAEKKAELAELKMQINEVRGEKSRSKVSGDYGNRNAVEASQPSGGWLSFSESTAFVPANEAIPHWTGGDKRRWGHEQAAGSPDTQSAGDIPSAWASKKPDGGEEWIKLDYDRFVDLDKVSVVESHNPGAISKVVAVLSDGSESLIWEGRMDPSTQDELVVSDFPAAEGVRARSVKVYMDTARVPGWNEIDAVQLVGRDGSKQWAAASSASSTYADP